MDWRVKNGLGKVAYRGAADENDRSSEHGRSVSRPWPYVSSVSHTLEKSSCRQEGGEDEEEKSCAVEAVLYPESRRTAMSVAWSDPPRGSDQQSVGLAFDMSG